MSHIFFPPTFQLPQFSLGQYSASAFIFELCLQLLYFHEETDGVCPDAWTCNIFFIKINSIMLPSKRISGKPLARGINVLFLFYCTLSKISHLVFGIRWVTGLVSQPVLVIRWIAAKLLLCVCADLHHLRWRLGWRRSCPFLWWHMGTQYTNLGRADWIVSPSIKSGLFFTGWKLNFQWNFLFSRLLHCWCEPKMKSCSSPPASPSTPLASLQLEPLSDTNCLSKHSMTPSWYLIFEGLDEPHLDVQLDFRDELSRLSLRTKTAQ